MSIKPIIALLAISLGIVIALTFTTLSKRATSVPLMQKGNVINEFPRLSVVAKNLEIPWAIAFLPNGNMFITERPGRVRMIDKSGNVSLVATIKDVKHIGEGGLLGITVHPDFDKNRFVYLYYTYEGGSDQTLNRVARFVFDGKTLTDKTVLVDAIPGAPNHNGGRIKFGPDNFLYITTGDAQNPSLAQNINSLAGKILRSTDEGKPASGNPFDNLIYSYGHRNSQGLVWDEKGILWATEHGQSAQDELNRIEPGRNFGWPIIRGDQRKQGMETPSLQSGSDTWAPSGAEFINGSIFFAGLRGQALYEAQLQNFELKTHLKGELGRIREVIIGPDNFLYITTSNRDGRGKPSSEDDMIIRLSPSQL